MSNQMCKMSPFFVKEIELSKNKIPANKEIIAMIPSKDEREYLLKTGWQFSEHDRDILRRYLKPKNKADYESVWFDQNYITLPHPFRKGDIVAVYDKNRRKKPSIGIVYAPKSDETFWNFDKRSKTELKNFLDFSDVCTTVEFLCPEDGTFRHAHPNPVWIEYAEIEDDSPKTLYLKSAARLMKGDGSLEETEYCRLDYVANTKKRRSKNNR